MRSPHSHSPKPSSAPALRLAAPLQERVAINNEVVACVSNSALISTDGSYGMLKLWIDGMKYAGVKNFMVIAIDEQAREQHTRMQFQTQLRSRQRGAGSRQRGVGPAQVRCSAHTRSATGPPARAALASGQVESRQTALHSSRRCSHAPGRRRQMAAPRAENGAEGPSALAAYSVLAQTEQRQHALRKVKHGVPCVCDTRVCRLLGQ